MTSPGSRDSFHSSPDRRQVRGTAPLDQWSTPLKPSDGGGQAQELGLEELAREIQQASKVVEAMRPRVVALRRAVQATTASSEDMPALFKGVSDKERQYTMQVAKLLAAQPEPMRRARIAVQQFDGAAAGLRAAQEAQARLLANGATSATFADFHLGKFKGAVYPLYNFSIVFEGIPLLDAMFPPMKAPPASVNPTTQKIRGTQPLGPLGEARATQPLSPEELPLNAIEKFVKDRPELSKFEPVLDKGLSLLRRAQQAAPGMIARVTGSLKGNKDSDSEPS